MKQPRLTLTRAAAARWLGPAIAVTLLASSPAAAAIAFVQTANNANSSNQTSISTTFGAAPTQGNVLVAIAGNRVSSTPSVPAGWTVAIDETANTPGQAIFYRIAGASEPATVTVSGYSTATRLGLHIYEYSGLAVNAPLDRTASASGSGSTLSSGTTATTSVADELLIAGFVSNEKNTNISNWTNSFAERNDFENAGSSAVESSYGGGDRIVAAAGAYSTSVTTDPSAPWRGQIVTFRIYRRVIVVGQ